MRLPNEIREQFRGCGRAGGLARAARMSPERRKVVARRAATARWIRERFGASDFATLGLPGGDVVDAGLADLAAGEVTVESLLVSLAAPRLRREGVPIGRVHAEPEDRLFELLSHSSPDLAHARYGAWLRRVASFADACRVVRRDRGRPAS
ncbi:MAG: hypothetical protein ACRD2Z_02440 [Thermoanaerobaculia bacterium]